MIDGHKVCWSMDVQAEELPLVLDTARTIGPRDADALRAIEFRIASGDKWAWCRVRVKCWVPGFGGFTGEDELRFCSFKGEEEFVARDWGYFNLRQNALRQLNANLYSLLQMVNNNCKLTSVEGLKAGDQVFASFLPHDHRYLLTVVDPGPDVAAGRVKLGESEVVLSAKRGHLPGDKVILPVGALVRLDPDAG